MAIMMVLSYITVSLIDLRLPNTEKGKRKLFIYILLMTISCFIGIANGYVLDMPSPAEPLKRIVLYILGK